MHPPPLRGEAETKTKQSLAMLGVNYPNFGKSHSASGPRPDASPPLRGEAETKDKISITSGTVIYVYSSDKSTLINTFTYARKAASGGLPRFL